MKHSKARIGDPVKVISSAHSGVVGGDKGVIDCRKGDGWGIAIDKVWPAAVSGQKPKRETRVVWMERKQFEIGV